ncbi:DUF6892 domain-containing protein [Yinghuangia seranimata]|uniref:DUF6892 domain-containing protein n=1 Tax=Yinghuangia seranimata TaxID=408067 RepID=UPI00248BA176|nr:hypothetical protein [Yinghuangia seranimata]MDI2129090.1 hypothetical protein [Yinghuangia seranimata]
MTNAERVELPDRNLQLALLDEVWRERVDDYYWLSSLREEYTAHQVSAGGPAWDDLEERLGIDDLPELEAFVLTLPLTADDLARVDDLCLDGDREVYTLSPDWWEFGRHFAITSLDGIGRCTGLVELDLNVLVDPCSLAPLAELGALRNLRVDAVTAYADLDVLAALPSLAELSVVNMATAEGSEDWRRVMGALRARGISVRGW